MSAFCDVALLFGLTFGGTCQPPPAVPDRSALPAEDPSAWALPAPPPAPAPERPPALPPVVVEKRVIVERPAPPAPIPEPKPRPKPVSRPAPRPDPWRVALEAAWARPAAPPADWGAPAWEATAPGPSLPPAPEGGPAAAPARPGPVPAGIPAAPADALALPAAPGIPERGEYEGPRRTSTLPVDNSRILAADRYITVILETGIDSQVGGDVTGTVIAQSARDVYGYHGRHVLIPKGSRLICDYQPPEDMGSTRLALTCSRILIAGHRAEIRQLAAPLGDVQGHQGVSGAVDRRFWERYGTAFLLTGISTAVRYAAAVGGGGNADDEGDTAPEKAAEELSKRFGEISAGVLKESLSLTPIITIAQGTRLQIRPAADWYIAPPGGAAPPASMPAPGTVAASGPSGNETTKEQTTKEGMMP